MEEVELKDLTAVEAWKALKESGCLVVSMTPEEEKRFKLGCQNIDSLYLSMHVKGGPLKRLLKIFAFIVKWPLFMIRDALYGRGSVAVRKALEVYQVSWHELDFVQVEKRKDGNLNVQFYKLTRV
jgi:hypothetical protein